jgi:hypothetical protein
VNKKQVAKKKVVLKLLPRQAAVVADIDILQHISATYQYMASECSDPQESEDWLMVSLNINQWISETYYSGELEDFDEEW